MQFYKRNSVSLNTFNTNPKHTSNILPANLSANLLLVG